MTDTTLAVPRSRTPWGDYIYRMLGVLHAARGEEPRHRDRDDYMEAYERIRRSLQQAALQKL